MKKKDVLELKNRSAEELQKFLHESREKLRVLKADLLAGKVKNIGEQRALKKDIARILTFITISKHATSE